VTGIFRYPRLCVRFKLGQLVHHTEFGTGTISSVNGCKVAIAFCDEERELDYEQVVTRALAEERWQDCYSHGANRRLEEGRWLWVIRSLCTQRGDWNAFLQKWGIPRSSAHDLIARFLQERRWDSQHASGNRTEGTPKLDGGTIDAAAQLNEGRKQLVREETTKREKDGLAQMAKLIYWPVRIKLPEPVAEHCRENYKEAGDEAKKYWVHAAYRFVDREDELDSASDAVQENGKSEE
jgi:hypothetical protein